MSEHSRPAAPHGDAATGIRASSIRPLARLLADPLAVWVIAGNDRISYLSSAAARWLGIDPDQLVGRTTTAAQSGDPFCWADAVAATLRPTRAAEGVSDPRRPLIATVDTVHPPAADDQPPPPPRRTLFIPLPDGDATAWLAIADVVPQTIEQSAGGISPSAWNDLMESVQRQLAIDPRQLIAPVALGNSLWAARLQRQITAAAQSKAHVTLYGPTGSGCEHVARAIHRRPQTTRDDLIRVAGSLMDAELFDATTGGIVSQFLEHGENRASLLIVDLDQMPRDAQQRLALLANNYGPRLRLFCTATIAPNQMLSKLVPDLAIGLGEIEIYLPPLADRVEDIPMLAAALLHRRAALGETTARQIGREALDRLVLYPFPQNFEELDAAIRGAARQCRGETLRVDDLPLAIRTHGRPEAESPEKQKDSRVTPLAIALADAERRCIEAALAHAQGNRAAAARLLEISRTKLLRRIEALGIKGQN
jgi:hypothetical protein